ncbi:MAG: hypothetical protein RIQ53_4142 [Pseudomonadota bacterium]
MPAMALELAFHGPPRPRQRAFRVLAGTVAAIAAVIFGGWIGYTVSAHQGRQTLRGESDHRLDLFAAAIESRVRRLEHVPATVQFSSEVLALLRQPDDPRRAATAGASLARLNAHLGSLAIFVLDERGTVLASSQRPARNGAPLLRDDSTPGQELAYRPYFLDALAGRVGRHFALGADGGEPGYFVSHPIRDGARVVGVAAIKISLAPVDDVWEMLGTPALLVDANQVVILSSQPDWRYTTLADLPLEQRVDLRINRMYGDVQLRRFPLPVDYSVDEESQAIEGELDLQPTLPTRGGSGMLVLGRALDGMDWRVLMFADLRPVRAQALRASLMSAVAVAFVELLALYLAQRRRLVRQRLEAQQLLQRANAELEHKVARRTRALTETNARLRREVAERQQAEQTLRAAQNELVHAGKMAVLGQLATGITHELTQPLGAIRTLSGNASEFLRRGDLQAVGGNLGIIARLADQMGGIIHPLKSFGRKSLPQPVATDVAQALANALFLYDQRIRRMGVRLDNRCAAAAAGLPRVWCGPNRLEQVLINLVGNALDAMQTTAEDARRLVLDAQLVHDLGEAEPRLLLSVSDSGPGFDEATRAHLFEPFYTTKPAGAGLGLGLAISRDIVREFGGEITAVVAEGGGARFELRLPLAPEGAALAAPALPPALSPAAPAAGLIGGGGLIGAGPPVPAALQSHHEP